MSKLDELRKAFIVDKLPSRLVIAKKTPHNSPCCRKRINMALSDGVLVGSCDKCGSSVIRVNPRTGKQEWLHGASPWTLENAPEEVSRD